MVLVGSLLLLIVTGGSPLAVAGVVVWAGWLRSRNAVPPFAAWAAIGLAGIAALVIVAGVLNGCFVRATMFGDDPSAKATALAEGISEVMNCRALGFLIAVAAAVWLGVWWLVGRRAKR